MTPYHGGSQCGAARHTVEATLDQPVTCNCSRRQRPGSVLVFAPRDAFMLDGGAAALSECLFARRQIRHLFCRTCGIESFAYDRKSEGAPMVRDQRQLPRGGRAARDRQGRLPPRRAAGVRACLAALLVAAAAPGVAQEVDCTQAMTQVELTFCAEADWRAADAALNAAYGQAMARMKAQDAALPAHLRGAEEQLRTAQRAWIVVRDAHCAAEGFAMRGGSGEAMVILGCRARLTRQRTADLAVLGQTY